MYAWEHVFSNQEVIDWINENIMRYDRDGYSYWAVTEKSSGQLVGVCGIIAESADNENYVGIGYIIFNKAFWHQGLAFESANACKNYAICTLRISELTAQIRPENLSSRNLAEKLGMSVISHVDEVKEIENLIEKLRIRLHAEAKGKCLTDPEAVKASQKLNNMLNKYEQLLEKICIL